MSFFKSIGNLFGGSNKTSSTSTTSSTPVLPANVQGAQTDLIDRVRAFAATPYEQYTGARVAGFTPDQLTGMQTARDVAASGGQLAQLTPDLVRRGVAATEGLATRLPDTDIQAYMNPYVEGVLDPMLRDIAERSAAERLRLGQQSARTGSFGGSRQAIAESELERGTQRTMAEEAAKQRAAAYTQAVNEFRRDQAAIPGLYAAALGQLGTGQEQIGRRLTGEVAPMLQIGGMQQALEQANLDVARRDFEERRDYPLRGIEVLRSALSLSPQSLGIGSTGTTTQQQTAPGPNLLAQITGTALNIPKFIDVGKDIGSLFGGGGGTATAANSGYTPLPPGMQGPVLNAQYGGQGQ
jgi:hypothetical protein